MPQYVFHHCICALSSLFAQIFSSSADKCEHDLFILFISKILSGGRNDYQRCTSSQRPGLCAN